MTDEIKKWICKGCKTEEELEPPTAISSYCSERCRIVCNMTHTIETLCCSCWDYIDSTNKSEIPSFCGGCVISRQKEFPHLIIEIKI